MTWTPTSPFLREGNDPVDALENEEDLPTSEERRERIETALTMALEAGAMPPIEYIGEGMTAVVFCDAGRAYKVAKYERAVRALQGEAEWLETASGIDEVAPHVARFIEWDPLHGVLIRQCARGSTGTWGGNAKIRAVWDEMTPHLLAHNWMMPEFKEDSFVFDEEHQPILVDAGFALRIGNRLLAYVQEVLDGERERDPHEDDSTLAFYVRREFGQTEDFDEDWARELLERLGEPE